jgi:bifunctional UDP-N-acetylglucosamine pyrophosphorylase/glucosamine-1-phosphate N-acetyltransferase
MGLQVIILAGGEGKRMNSHIPKVLHKLNGKTMLECVVNSVIRNCDPDKILVVSGHNAELFKNELQNVNFKNILFIPQTPPRGTGDAVRVCLPYLQNGSILILNGDTPLIDTSIKSIVSNGTPSLMVMNLDNPFGQGRVVVEDNMFKKIVEEKDATDNEKTIKTVNCGVYYLDTETIENTIPKLNCNNMQNEFYLTDICEMISDDLKLYILPIEKHQELLNVNTQEDLSKAIMIM